MTPIRGAMLCLTLLVMALAGCPRHTEPPRVAPSELKAIEAIHDTSTGNFHNAAIELQIREGGSVELILRGRVQSKPGFEGDVWIPLLLAKELPDYFQSVQSGGSAGASLEAYQLRGGLWCIAAVVRQAADTANTERSDGASYSMTVDVALVSPPFADRLPFLIPAGQQGEAVAVSIALPDGASFTSSASAVGITTVRGWHDRRSAESAQTTTMQKLTALPAALSGGGTRLAATLYTPDAVALDFSGIRFAMPGFWSHFRPWFFPLEALLGLSAIALWLRLDLVPAVRRRIGDLQDLRHQAAAAIEQELGELTMAFERLSADGGERWSGTITAWRAAASRIRALLADLETERSLRPEDTLDHVLSSFNQNIAKLRAMQPIPPFSEEITVSLGALQLRLRAFDSLRNRLVRQRERQRTVSTGAWCTGGLALAAALLLIAILAHAQTSNNGGPPAAVADGDVMLGDFDIQLTPRDTQAKPSEKVDVQVRFAALTSRPHDEKATVEFGTGELPGISIDTLVAPTDPKVTVLSQSGTHLSVSVPATYSPRLKRFGALSSLATQFVSGGFTDEVAAANHVSFLYTLQGSEVFHARSGWAKWVYLFPFDSADVDIPIDVRESALLSHILLQKPSIDYFADPSVDAIPLSLGESENGDRYEFTSDDAGLRTPLWKDQKLAIHAKFIRSPRQRWGLTLGVAILGIVVGVIAGVAIRLSEKSWQAYVITTFGITGLVFAVRAAVLATYKDLPTLLTAQGTSYFELCYLACVVLMVGVIYVMRK